MATIGDKNGGPRRFDWPAAHARLNRAIEKIETAANPSPADVQRILGERARVYALTRREETDQSFVDVIGFSIGEDRFAVELGCGAAATALTNLTHLPGAPAYYLGLISHRGSIFPIIDPRPLLGVKRDSVFSAHCAVLIRDDRSALGFAAEEIQGVTRFKTSEIATVTLETSRLRAVQGVGPRDTVIIDATSLMRDARLLVDDQPLIAAN